MLVKHLVADLPSIYIIKIAVHVHMYAKTVGKSFIMLFFLTIPERGQSWANWYVMIDSTS